ncbi:MAG: VCBS repeat-containing protein [Acidobacteriota bacterium]|nr:VCBS repeat-containing protein [Acidobacteriota bacterium]
MFQKNLNNLSQTAAIFALLLFCSAFFTQMAFAVGVCSNVTVRAGSLVPVGIFPRAIATADLDGDGDLDMAVANAGSGGFNSTVGSVSILLNDGAGNFLPGTTLNPNLSAQAVAVADFNSDGISDLVVGGGSSNSSGGITVGLAIYYGNGNGNFGFPILINTTTTVNSLATTDLNRDGLPDIIAATAGNAVLSFTNTGNDFALSGTTSVGNNPRSMVVADFNGDGIPDAVTANQGTNNLSVLYGQANGTFAVALNLPAVAGNASITPATLAAGDLNGDNRIDLVVGGSGGSSSLMIFLNNGSSGFAPPTNFSAQFNSSSVQGLLLGRFFGENKLDVAVITSGSFSDEPGRVVIYRGLANGNFDANVQFTFPTGNAPAGGATADFNNDGRPDIATANSGSNNVAVLLSNSQGGLGARQTLLGVQPSSVIAADFNGDGFLDAVVSGSSSGSSQVLTFYLGDANGNFGPPQSIPIVNSAAGQFLAADLNNDSRLDLIAYGATNFGSVNTFTVYINNGSSMPFNVLPPPSYNFTGVPTSAALGDFNGDGRRDIIAALSNNSVGLLLGGANGTFVQSQTSFAVGIQPSAITVGDFNGDNFLDAAIAGSNSNTSSSSVIILFGNGAGNFTSSSAPITVLNSPNGIVNGDFNGDGRLDLAVSSTGNFSGSNSFISILFGTGDGRFGNPVVYTVGSNARSLRVGDFNGDSRPDLAVANRSSNTVSLLINSGSGSFSQTLNYLSGILPNAIDIGDFNRDRRLDVIAANQIGATLFGFAPGTLSILTNSCREAITKTDYDGDGRTDFAVFRPASGTWFVTSNGVDYIQRQFGAGEDIPVQADYDGDGETDIAVYRPSTRTWYVLRSSTNSPRAVQWGAAGDIPVPGDYNGDGRADIAVFRPSNGTWYILPNFTPSQFLALRWGQTGDVPVQADYDGDGRTDLAVFRAGTWFIQNSSNNSFRAQQFGLASDIPLVGDYDGDGKSDLAVFRGGNWFLLLSATNAFRGENFGLATDRPQPGDYDGDGRTDLAVYRDGAWYVRQSSNNTFRAVIFGTASDVPVASTNRIQ